MFSRRIYKKKKKRNADRPNAYLSRFLNELSSLLFCIGTRAARRFPRATCASPSHGIKLDRRRLTSLSRRRPDVFAAAVGQKSRRIDRVTRPARRVTRARPHADSSRNARADIIRCQLTVNGYAEKKPNSKLQPNNRVFNFIARFRVIFSRSSILIDSDESAQVS